ncbi:MAG: hypothetical protein COU11_00680 [Candidatus Harrisonbacteria bacterium CG10_big_fil_rev_8_21_14_0_10_49_15]|uniref:Uncharacterized protein n=1 Tax=Candidatus Harrisonbacteria bacterium CG10_big_fil_rev_8_21_14_0_10_49_15 TaxID=1974587 RepID=A0A2H0UNP4_9BACT|nr:MAG: hypothetical protein COU11_00680 [Candidatus Harrisonbacteria bacterium CG10_big_fil_rev_8_21_14_0_10_49_15]
MKKTDQSSKKDSAADQIMSDLKKDFRVVGRGRVHAWYAFLSIGVLAGITLGVMLVANRSGQLEGAEAARQTRMGVVLSGSAQNINAIKAIYTIDVKNTNPNSWLGGEQVSQPYTVNKAGLTKTNSGLFTGQVIKKGKMSPNLVAVMNDNSLIFGQKTKVESNGFFSSGDKNRILIDVDGPRIDSTQRALFKLTAVYVDDSGKEVKRSDVPVLGNLTCGADIPETGCTPYNRSFAIGSDGRVLSPGAVSMYSDGLTFRLPNGWRRTAQTGFILPSTGGSFHFIIRQDGDPKSKTYRDFYISKIVNRGPVITAPNAPIPPALDLDTDAPINSNDSDLSPVEDGNDAGILDNASTLKITTQSSRTHAVNRGTNQTIFYLKAEGGDAEVKNLTLTFGGSALSDADPFTVALLDFRNRNKTWGDSTTATCTPVNSRCSVSFDPNANLSADSTKVIGLRFDSSNFSDQSGQKDSLAVIIQEETDAAWLPETATSTRNLTSSEVPITLFEALYN